MVQGNHQFTTAFALFDYSPPAILYSMLDFVGYVKSFFWIGMKEIYSPNVRQMRWMKSKVGFARPDSMREILAWSPV